MDELFICLMKYVFILFLLVKASIYFTVTHSLYLTPPKS